MGADVQTPPHEQYLADGFFIVDQPVLPRDIVEAAVAGMDEVRHGRYGRGDEPNGSNWKPGDDPNQLCKIENPQRANQAIYDLVSHPALGELAVRVTGGAMIQVWWTQLLYKPSSPPSAQAHTNIGWHQDRDYWTSWQKDSQLFTAWFALSDVQADCGPMTFLRGSNHWGHLVGGSDFFGQDLQEQQRNLEAHGHAWDPTPVLLPAGGVSFHDRLTFHASEANVSDTPRRSLAIHMRTEKSAPVDEPHDLTAYLDNPCINPVIYGNR